MPLTLNHDGTISSSVVNTDATNTRVGIGTSTPEHMLHLKGSFPYIAFEDTDNANTSIGTITGNSDGNIYYDANFTNTAGVNGGHRWRINGATLTPMYIDQTTGIVAKPNQPGFYARGNTSQWQTQTTGVWYTPVSGIGDTGDGVRWGHNMTTSGTGCFNSGHYSVSTGRFTAPISGQYCFSYSFHSNVPNNVDYANANFLINGSLIKGTLTQGGYYFTKAGASAEFMGKTTATFYLNSGDYVELQLNNPTGNVRYYSDYVMFSGHFIG